MKYIIGAVLTGLIIFQYQTHSKLEALTEHVVRLTDHVNKITAAIGKGTGV